MANWSECEVTIEISKTQFPEIYKNKFDSLYRDFCRFLVYSGGDKIPKEVTDNVEKLAYNINHLESVWIDSTGLMKDYSISERSNYSMAEVSFLDTVDNSDDIALILSLSGRWCAPSGFFKYLAEKHTPSKLVYIDREGGCNFTHVMVIEDGKVTVDKQDTYISKLAFEYLDRDNMLEELFDRLDEEAADNLKKFTLKEFKEEYKEYYKIIELGKCIPRLKKWLKENK